jgi:ferric enterobactin receptor
MRVSLFLAGLLFLNLTSFAQVNPGKINYSGTIKDSITGLPMDKATVHLKSSRSTFNAVAVSDSTGSFAFDNLSTGNYTLHITYAGYRPFSKSLSLQNPLAESIYMTPQSGVLQNVVVTAQKSLVENKVDKLVYNPDKDITAQGGTATDILAKVPQVTVDVNGNVELLGNPSVQFLINGKKSVIFGNSVSDALQSIPASQIQSIEVISSPGARYDASGTGGIINIILKKTRSEGFSGTVNATAGTRLENGSLNLTYKKNNVSINSYFSGSSQVTVKTLTNNTRNSFDTTTGNNYYLLQQGYSNFTRDAWKAGIGADWDLTAKDNITFSAGYNHFGNTNDGFVRQYNRENDVNGAKLEEETNNRHANARFNNGTFDIGADYKKKFKKEKQELSVSLNYSYGNNNTSYLQSQQYLVTDSIFGGSTSKNPGKDQLLVFSIDYSMPLSKDLIVETGVRTASESLISNANVLTFSPSRYEYIFDDKQSYTSEFRRQVYAGYVSANFQLFKILRVVAGARLEHTINSAYYSNSGKPNIPDYNNFGPSVIISHNLTDQQSVKLGYAYRLERPEYRDLNPFVNLADPHNITTGNPYIQPEIGNDFQLGYTNNFGKDNYINVVLLYTYNSPDIKSYTTFYPTYPVGDSLYTNVNVTRRSNIASEQRWGLNIAGAFTIAPGFTLRPNIQLYKRRTNNIYSIPKTISGFEYRGNINANYQFNKNLVAEIFGNYRSGIKWQGRQAGFYSYSIAVRRQLFKGNGSIGLVAVNAFGKYLVQKTTQNAVGFNGTTELNIPYRSFGVNFTYKFGKIKISKPKEAENLLAKPPVE